MTTWTARDGTRMDISYLTDEHLLNVERFLSFRGATAPGVHPSFLEKKREAVDAEIDLRGLSLLPTIKEWPIPPCPYLTEHPAVYEAADWFPCFFCGG